MSFADSLTLNLIKHLEPGEYNIALKLTDGQGLSHVTTVKASVCNCDGSAKNCDRKAVFQAGLETAAILGILGGILALLSEYCAPFLLVIPREAWPLLLRSHLQMPGFPALGCEAHPRPGLAWMSCRLWPVETARTWILLRAGENCSLSFLAAGNICFV